MLHSVIFRLCSMGAKFLFLVVAASKLTASELSQYGGINSLVLLSIYLIGADLYIDNSRKLVNNEKEKYNINLSNQIIFSFILITVYLLIINIFKPKIVDSFLIIFSLLVVFEFINQEIYRLLLALGKYKQANILFFIKTGGWCLLSVLLLFIQEIQELKQIIWLVSCILSLVFGVSEIKGNLPSFVFSTSFRVFKLNFTRNARIFSSSLALLSINNLDKIYLASMDMGEEVASYIFFSSLISSVLTIIYSGIVNPYYKQLVSNKFNDILVVLLLKKILAGGLSCCAFIFISLYFCKDLLLSLIGKEYLQDSYHIMYYLMFNMILVVIALVPHYYLFAFEKDKEIAIVSFVVLISQIILMPTLYSFFGVEGVIYSVLISTLLMFCLKSVYVFKIKGKV